MKIAKLKDQELVEMYMEGNSDCMEVLVKRHKERVYTYILLIVKHQEFAENIFQETFIKVIKSLRRKKYHEREIWQLLNYHQVSRAMFVHGYTILNLFPHLKLQVKKEDSSSQVSPKSL